METETIKQVISVEATTIDVYNMFLDSEKHSEITKAEARISSKTGEPFSAHNGYITGVNLDLIPGKKIVQSWKPTEENWPVDHYSEITLEFEATDYGCLIHFTHKNIPKKMVELIEKGWIEYYWNPLKEYIETENKFKV